ncbi:uncharacterized protein LOC135836844 isoform X2 [Planococcus citri]|uniref:uncharacterized protein LOC135836844 isoform X2 n=1 Tax=Planococcus citri TaxID=170843 RepID=UPI0031F945A4
MANISAGDASSSVGNVDFHEEEKSTQENEKFGLFVLEDLLKRNLVTDIGNIMYTAGEGLLSSRQNMSVTDISEPFCDNIILAKIYNDYSCEKQKYRKTPYTVKKKATSFSINYLKHKFNHFLGTSTSSQPKYSIRTDGSAYSLWNMKNGRANGIEEIIRENNLTDIIKNKYRDPVYMIFKIDLADVNFTTLLKQLPMILQELRRNHYFLLDLNITQDLTGIFNKKEMCNYLKRNKEFRENFNVIVDNDKSVGIDCLTWVNSNTRVKIYNKFVCQMTSPGVRQKIGNRIVDFIYCPNNRLSETFQSDLAQRHGILRLEATIYNYNYSYPGSDKSYDPVKHCRNLLANCKKYLESAPIYSVPIQTMWRKLINELRNSCCLVNDNILQYVYWANGVTGKFTGIVIELPTNDPNERERLINYAISQFSFNNLPVNKVEIVNGLNGKSEVRECYIKNGDTYFSYSYTFDSSIPIDLNITETGLVPTDNVIPRVLRHSESPFVYPITKIDPEPDLNPYEPSPKKRKLDSENGSQEREADGSWLSDFRHNEWMDLDSTGYYKVFAFAVVKSQNSRSFVVVYTQNNRRIRQFYSVKGVSKSEFIDRYYDESLLIEGGYKIIPADDMTTLPATNL